MARYVLALCVDAFVSLGPFPLGQHLGTKKAMVIVKRLMEQGREKTIVQFVMARQARSTLTVLWEFPPYF